MCTASPLYLPLQQRLLLAENEYAFSISPSDLHSKHTLLVIRNNLLLRDFAVVIDSLWTSTVSNKRACAVTFVYVVAIATVYK